MFLYSLCLKGGIANGGETGYRYTRTDNIVSDIPRGKNQSYIRDLDLLTIGMVNDMYVESRNDEHKYAVVATQEDFDRF